MKTPESLTDIRLKHQMAFFERLDLFGVRGPEVAYLRRSNGVLLKSLAECIHEVVRSSVSSGYKSGDHVWGPECWQAFFGLELEGTQVDSAHECYIPLEKELIKPCIRGCRDTVGQIHLAFWMPRSVKGELFTFKSWYDLLSGPGSQALDLSSFRTCMNGLPATQADFGGWHVVPLDYVPRPIKSVPMNLNSPGKYGPRYKVASPLITLTRLVLSLTLGLEADHAALVSVSEADEEFCYIATISKAKKATQRKGDCVSIERRRYDATANRRDDYSKMGITYYRPSLELITNAA
jgi:hypothetical protein